MPPIDLHADPAAPALCARLDAGDDDKVTLPALADRLEELGDPRAAGLRLIGSRQPWHMPSGRIGWFLAGADYELPSDWPDPPQESLLLGGIYRALEGTNWDSRSHALLALAEAMLSEAANL